MQRGRTKARALRSYGQCKLARSASADPQGVEVQPAAQRALDAGSYRSRARMVYCVPAEGGLYAVGLQLYASAGEWVSPE
jgi:hypothetical protein